MNRRPTLSGLQLKLLALLTMTMDHAGAVLVRGSLYRPLRDAGRLAFPIYCFLLVEGYLHTRDVKKYLGRLLFAFLLSELPFDAALYRSVPAPRRNVMLTLALGLVTVLVLDRVRGALWGRRPFPGREALCRKQGPPPLWLELPLCFAVISAGMRAAFWLQTDYRGGGVLLIVLFFVFREQKEALLLTVPPLLLVFYTPMELWGTLALLPIALYDPQKGRTARRASPQQPKSRRGRALQWFFYLYYPAHLTVLALLRDLLLHTPVTLELPF